MFAALLNFLSVFFLSFLIFANICQDNKFIMATQFGEKIRELRTKQNMLLRQLASKLDVDTSIISKVERGDRQLKKEQIPLLAEILQADKEELLMLWLADQLYNVIEGEPMGDEALKSVSKKIKKAK
jgi:HTH-type transcriptional regulator, competence development regulator